MCGLKHVIFFLIPFFILTMCIVRSQNREAQSLNRGYQALISQLSLCLKLQGQAGISKLRLKLHSTKIAKGITILR